MDVDGFWAIVERALVGHERDEENSDGHAETLHSELEPFSDDELTDFDNLCSELERRADRIDVWGAGYVLNGGMSDSSFIDFRSWLVSRGRRAYEAVLADPDALAEVVPGLTIGYQHSASRYAWVAAEIYGERHDEEPPEDFDRTRALVEASVPPAERDLRDSPMTSAWWEEDEAELERLYPRISALVAAQEFEPEPAAAGSASLTPEQVIEFHPLAFLHALGELVMAPRELRHAWYADGSVLGVQIVNEGSTSETAPKADYDGWTLWLGHGKLDEPLSRIGVRAEPGALDADDAFDRAYNWFVQHLKQ